MQGMIKQVEERFEWLSFDNDFLYPLITIWFKRMLNTSFNNYVQDYKLPTWDKGYTSLSMEQSERHFK